MTKGDPRYFSSSFSRPTVGRTVKRCENVANSSDSFTQYVSHFTGVSSLEAPPTNHNIYTMRQTETTITFPMHARTASRRDKTACIFNRCQEEGESRQRLPKKRQHCNKKSSSCLGTAVTNIDKVRTIRYSNAATIPSSTTRISSAPYFSLSTSKENDQRQDDVKNIPKMISVPSKGAKKRPPPQTKDARDVDTQRPREIYFDSSLFLQSRE